MLRSTVVLPADHSSGTVARRPSQAAEASALWHRAGSALVGLFGRSPARAGAGVDQRDGEVTHRIWRGAAVGGGPGMR
jgi:hypothetical protein